MVNMYLKNIVLELKVRRLNVYVILSNGSEMMDVLMFVWIFWSWVLVCMICVDKVFFNMMIIKIMLIWKVKGNGNESYVDLFLIIRGYFWVVILKLSFCV